MCSFQRTYLKYLKLKYIKKCFKTPFTIELRHESTIINYYICVIKKNMSEKRLKERNFTVNYSLKPIGYFEWDTFEETFSLKLTLMNVFVVTGAIFINFNNNFYHCF
jgi:hypothetical protein